MGILDDAIREHLELKRQHGADGDDVERLEKEAFGPPTRPGDPEFDTSEQEAAEAAAAAAEDDDAGSEDPTTVAPAAPATSAGPPAAAEEVAPERESDSAGIFDAESDQSDDDWLVLARGRRRAADPRARRFPGYADRERRAAAAPALREQRRARHLRVDASPARSRARARGSSGPDTSESSIELTPAEQARIEHADLGDTVAHEAIPDPSTGSRHCRGAGRERAHHRPGRGGRAAGAARVRDLRRRRGLRRPRSGARHRRGRGGVGAPQRRSRGRHRSGDRGSEVGRSVPLEPESEEYRARARSDETELARAPPRSSTDEFEADDAEEDDLEDEDEDLLEETPDFLQDTPEGDRLWFEQSGPKDFDFDDDDKKD